MEGQNKLLLDLDGKTVLEHVASEVLRSPFSQLLAVTGHDGAEIESALTSLNIPFIRNENFASGMHSSIRKGLLALDTSIGFFAVCLSDQPFLRASDFEALIQAASVHPEAMLITPVIAGERGHPTLISIRLRDEILAHADDDRGCHYLLKKYEAVPVDLTEFASALAFHDVDTPHAYEQAKRFLAGDLT